MNIDNDYYVESDGHQFILRKRRSGELQDYNVGYYRSIECLLTAYIRKDLGKGISDGDIKTLQDLYARLNSITETLSISKAISKLQSNPKKKSSRKDKGGNKTDSDGKK